MQVPELLLYGMAVAFYIRLKEDFMKSNESMTDRSVRVILGVLLGMTVIFKIATGVVAIVAGIAAGIALITGLVGFCALYALFGISTCKTAENPQ
jgi:spore coat polysaccharide biosynthesis predicted glycosyltransferase SpsG